jgi:hypothetical protein
MFDSLNFTFDSSFGPLDISDTGPSTGLGTEVDCLDTENTAWMLLTPVSTPAPNPTGLNPHEALENNLVDLGVVSQLGQLAPAQVSQVRLLDLLGD